MSLENYLLTELVRQITPTITGQSVGRIFEPSPLEFALGFKNGSCLYVSLLPARPGIFLTERAFKSLEGDRGPTHLTNLMRKYVANATLSEIVKTPNERQILLTLRSFDATGATLNLGLMIDLMGRSANAHLFINNAYLASLREMPDSTAIMAFTPATPTKTYLNASLLSETELSNLLSDSALEEVAKSQLNFSPTLVREWIKRSSHVSPYQALQSLSKDLNSSSQSAYIYAPQAFKRIEDLPLATLDPRKNLLLSYFPLEMATGLVPHTFDSLTEAVASYFALLERLAQFSTERNRLLTKVRGEIAKLVNTLAKLQAEATEFSQAGDLRRIGELILANLGTLTRTKDTIKLIDYYDPLQKELIVEIKEQQSPQQLAEDYFARYQRARRGQEAIAKRINNLGKELATKQAEMERLLAAFNETSLNSAETIPTTKTPPKSAAKTAADKDKLSGLRRYLSSDSYEILVGRSDAGNEKLTFQIAKSADIWLHTADYPGSHVVIRNLNRSVVPQRTIIEAAQLAAFFSKARNETQAAVRYTERKHISRPKKAKPGLALLTQFKTIMVTPQEASQRVLD